MTRRNHPIEFALPMYLQEVQRKNLTMRWAAVLAVLTHLTLFAVKFPEMSVEAAVAVAKPVFAVRPIRFRPPVVTPERVRAQRARRVPIPDPTPDDPKPLLIARVDEAVLDALNVAPLIGIPPAPPPFERTEPVRYRSEMVRPERIAGGNPRYTEIARKARLEGAVILQAVISREGTVRSVEILKPLGLGLEDSAADAVRSWRFRPARLNGEPIDVVYNLTVRFALH